MINSTIAKRYALSLVQLGAECGLVDRFRGELADVENLFSTTPEIPAAFADPALSHERKKNIMRELVGSCACSELMGNFLLLLVDKNRVAFFSQIVKAYGQLADEHLGILRPVITTAFELDAGQLAAIREALEKKSAKTIIPQLTVDKAFLGGVVVQIGDTVYDSSVKTQLKRLQDQLQKG
jgi:F-type H+-transporting ATPase subunit delta